LHKLSDILVIAFCAIICGVQTSRDLEIFDNAKKSGSPIICRCRTAFQNTDTFERIFEMLNPNIVAEKMRWLLQSDEIAGKIIAFDGKTMRGSKREEGRGAHVLSAFLTDAQIVMGEIACDEKSNEITAIPELLDIINVEKSIVTIDAMGTQTKIAEKIISKKRITVLRSRGIIPIVTTTFVCILRLKRLKGLRYRAKKDMVEPKGVSTFSKLKSIGSTGVNVGRGFAQNKSRGKRR